MFDYRSQNTIERDVENQTPTFIQNRFLFKSVLYYQWLYFMSRRLNISEIGQRDENLCSHDPLRLDNRSRRVCARVSSYELTNTYVDRRIEFSGCHNQSSKKANTESIRKHGFFPIFTRRFMSACKDSARESRHYQEMATSKPLTRKIPVASCVSFKCFCIGSAPGRQKTRHSEVCNSTSPPDPGKIPQGLSEITRTVTLTLTFCYELLFCPLPVFFFILAFHFTSRGKHRVVKMILAAMSLLLNNPFQLGHVHRMSRRFKGQERPVDTMTSSKSILLSFP